ncbi:hypothetical protein Dimus_030026 [Dionaea muscipula]
MYVFACLLLEVCKWCWAYDFISLLQGGSYVHARGASAYHVFRHITVTLWFCLRSWESLVLQFSFGLLFLSFRIQNVSAPHIYSRHNHQTPILLLQDYSNLALQYFLGVKTETALYFLMQWVKSYQTLFIKPCSNCRRVLSVDRQSSLFLPPVLRPYRQFYGAMTSSALPKDQNLGKVQAFHMGCSSQDV